MAFTIPFANVGPLGDHLDQGTRLCYHDVRPEERVLVHAGRTGQARAHVERGIFAGYPNRSSAGWSGTSVGTCVLQHRYTHRKTLRAGGRYSTTNEHSLPVLARVWPPREARRVAAGPTFPTLDAPARSVAPGLPSQCPAPDRGLTSV